MTPDQIEAEALSQAEVTGRQRRLILLAHPQARLDQVYAVQATFAARKLAAARRGIGRRSA